MRQNLDGSNENQANRVGRKLSHLLSDHERYEQFFSKITLHFVDE
jgi:hypothetical protein